MAPRRRMALARGFRTHLVGVLGSLRIDARAERAESFELHGMAIEDKVVDGLDESLHAARFQTICFFGNRFQSF